MGSTTLPSSMNLFEFNNYLNSFLKKEDFPYDPSRNGIQIQNSAPETKKIKKVAFAVDACEESALKAYEQNADVLVTHHGLFWGDCQTITASHYKRISAFIKNDLALISYHIPLDANCPYGNNFGMANKIGLKNLQQFGSWKGMVLGVKGEFEHEISLDELASLIEQNTFTKVQTFAFGKNKIKTAGISSGGSGDLTNQAVAENLDAFVTGEFGHEEYHYAKEMGINIIVGGHYGTEIIGVSLLKEKVEKELGLETVFIDLPTGL